MAINTKSESTTDSKGVVVTTQTWEAFDSEPSAPAGAKNIKRTHADGKYTLTYDDAAGSEDPNDPTNSGGTTYSVEGSMSQEPIETHEKFRSVSAEDWKKWNLWKNNSKDEELAGWKPEEGAIAELSALYDKGVTDYLVPRAVVRVTKIEGGSPQLSRLGKISSPAGAPTLPSGATWMLTGASGNSGADGKWSNSYEYMSSGPAGWNTDIYN